MVLSWSLGAFLLCLLSPCLRKTEAQNVDQNTLARIISHIEERYRPTTGQYAVAINIPEGKCGPGIFPHDGFLTDDPEEVRNIINPPNRGTYEGNSMIAALPNQSFHSEYRLMKYPNEQNSPLAKLLNKNPLGCVIFYTYFSPCDQTCLNPANTRNILTAIQMFARHRGPKAFVYNQIFNNNDAGIVAKGRVINDNAFLYRCYLNPTAYGCHHCIQDNQIRPECRAQRQQNAPSSVFPYPLLSVYSTDPP